MGSKINQGVYGTVPTTQYSKAVCPKTILDLYNDGNFDPSGNCENGFEKSISPWGIGGGMCGDWFTIDAQRSANGRYARLRMDTTENFNKPISFWNKDIKSSDYDNKNSTRFRVAGNCKFSDNTIVSNGATENTLTLQGINANISPYGKLEYNNACAYPFNIFITRNENSPNNKLTPLGQYTVAQIDSFSDDWFQDSFEMAAFNWGLAMYRSAPNVPNQFYPITISTAITKSLKMGEMYKALALEDNANRDTFYDNAIISGFNTCGVWAYSHYVSVSDDNIKLVSNKFTDTTHYNYTKYGPGQMYGVGNGNKHVFDDISYHYEIRFFVELNGNYVEINENEIILSRQKLYILPYYKIDDTTYSSKWESIKAIIRHELAFIGFPFVMNANQWNFIGADNVSVPIFDEHMITTGNYLTGAAAQQLPNAQWGDIFDDSMPEYDPDYEPDTPGPGPGPGPDPNPNPLYPSSPGFSLASAGGKCYALVDGTIDTIFEEIYGRDEESWLDLISGLSLYGADPMAAIISYKWYPWAWSFTGTAGLYLGGTRIGNSGYDVPRTDAEALHTENASFYYGREKNFINSRHSQARLWLPFYGFYALPQQKFISEKLTVDFHYNLPDEVGVWIISFDDVIYDFVECQCSIDVPLSATDYRGQKYAAISGVLSAAGNLVNSVGDIAKSAIAVGIGGATAAGAASAYQADTGQSIFSAIKKEGIAAFQAFDGTQKMQIGMMGSGAAQAAGGTIGIGTSVLGAGMQGFNDVMSTRRTLNQMKINLPYHGAASPTTFLNLPMFPFVQVYTNNTIDDYVGKDSQYKLKNGHACDKWVTASEMPSNSLCQASGIADMNTSGMELSEVEELNSILQSGFFIAIE